MTETEGPQQERSPQTPDQILGKVGVTPEQLRGKRLLFFGNESNSLLGKIEGADVIAPDVEAFYIFNELLPTGEQADFVLGIENEYLGDLSNPDRVDLLVAAIESAGEVRITQQDAPSEIQDDYAHALYDRGLDVEVTYVDQGDEGSYITIRQM